MWTENNHPGCTSGKAEFEKLEQLGAGVQGGRPGTASNSLWGKSSCLFIHPQGGRGSGRDGPQHPTQIWGSLVVHLHDLLPVGPKGDPP